jgi:hypothetical protein
MLVFYLVSFTVWYTHFIQLPVSIIDELRGSTTVYRHLFMCDLLLQKSFLYCLSVAIILLQLT